MRNDSQLTPRNDGDAVSLLSSLSSAYATTSKNTHPAILSKTINHDDNNFNNPLQPIIDLAANRRFDMSPPIFGEHNKAADAVLVFAYGYQPPAILRFVESLIDTGYYGDIVLGLNYEMLMRSLEKGKGGGIEGEEKDDRLGVAAGAFESYLEHRSKVHNLVVYDVKLECDPKDPTTCTAPYMYRILDHESHTSNRNTNSTTNIEDTTAVEFLPDPRIARSVKLLRYEYYWAWSTNYVNADTMGSNRIFLSDLRDVYFQRNPFNASSWFASRELYSTTADATGDDASYVDKQYVQQTSLQVFVEDTSKFVIGTQTSNARWIRAIKGEKVLGEIGHNPIGDLSTFLYTFYQYDPSLLLLSYFLTPVMFPVLFYLTFSSINQ